MLIGLVICGVPSVAECDAPFPFLWVRSLGTAQLRPLRGQGEESRGRWHPAVEVTVLTTCHTHDIPKRLLCSVRSSPHSRGGDRTRARRTREWGFSGATFRSCPTSGHPVGPKEEQQSVWLAHPQRRGPGSLATGSHGSDLCACRSPVPCVSLKTYWAWFSKRERQAQSYAVRVNQRSVRKGPQEKAGRAGSGLQCDLSVPTPRGVGQTCSLDSKSSPNAFVTSENGAESIESAVSGPYSGFPHWPWNEFVTV